MGFSSAIKEEILVKSARHCCVCHNGKGLNIEIHHIIPKKQGGEDTFDNAIALCFDCHADAGHYFAGHPKGIKLSPEELRKNKIQWFEIVMKNKIEEPLKALVNVSLLNGGRKNIFRPIFIKEKTIFTNRNFYKDSFSLLGKDFMEYVEEAKNNNFGLNDFHLQKVKSYDDFIDYLNGKHLEIKDSNDDTNCQPVIHKLGPFRFYKMLYKCNCVLNLKLTNNGPEILENYKLYLKFKNVVSVDSVDKLTSVFDSHPYSYNVKFNGSNQGEFLPQKDVLVQRDSVVLDSICFRPVHKVKSITINWELYARNIFSSGELQISVKPRFISQTNQIFVENADELKAKVKILPKIEIA